MLDFLRRSATSVFAWLILGALALAFGLSFGLPSDSITFGAEKYVKVHGHSVGDEEFRYQLSLASRWGLVPKEALQQEAIGAREEALEGIVERIVLAKAAQDLGLGATERDVEDLILDGHVIMFGYTLDFLGPENEFNYKMFKQNWLRPLGIAEQRYLEYQQEEYLARTMRDVIRSGATVPEPVLRAAYEERANQISLRYARYEAATYGEVVDPTDAEIAEYAETHVEELAQQFAAQGSRFAKLGKQMRVWVVEIPKPAAEDPLLDGDDDGEPEDPTPSDSDGPRRAIDLARVRIASGEDFRAVARAVSSHPSARRGGDLGWIGEGLGTGLDAAVDDAARAAVEGDPVSEVLEGDASYFLVRVTGRREGDVSQADAFVELAAEAVRRAKGSELARAAAEADKAAILTDGKAVTEVFATPDALDLAGALGEPLEDVPIDGAPTGDANRRDKVELRETGLTPKGQPLKGLGGPAPELVTQAWADETGAMLLDNVFPMGDDFVLAGVVSRAQGSDAEYKEQRAELYADAVRQKGGTIASRFAERQCLEAKAKGDLVVSDSKVTRLMTYDIVDEKKAEEGEAEEPGKKPYSVCERVGNRGGFLTARLRFLEVR